MEIRNRLMQRLRRIIREHPLKIAEGHRTVIEILRAFHFFQADRPLDEQEQSPVISVAVLIIILTASGLYDIQGFPVRLSALRNNHFTQIRRYINDIFHELLRIPENFVIHSL